MGISHHSIYGAHHLSLDCVAFLSCLSHAEPQIIKEPPPIGGGMGLDGSADTRNLSRRHTILEIAFSNRHIIRS